MNKKLYSFLGLLIGITAIFAVNFFKEPLGGAFIYLLGFFIAVACISFFELIFLFKKKTTVQEGEVKEEKELPNYSKKAAVMSKSEIRLYGVLKELFSDRYEILAQTALVSVIDKLTQNSYRTDLFRVVDFCIADKETFAPLILIELNDSSHSRADRAERDRKVALICERARLPLVSFSLQEINEAPHIRRTVLRNILKK